MGSSKLLKITLYLILFLAAQLLWTSVFAQCGQSVCEESLSRNNVVFREKVIDVVKGQMANYPESRLQDLYKNFFQDKFGPGHIIADTASAGNYIRMELNSVTVMSQKEYAEITGWEGKFVRVDLAVLKNGLVGYKTFSDAFFESATVTTLPSLDEWGLEWREIEKIVKEFYPNLPGLDKDSRELEAILASGNYAVHHSKEYESAYKPHYRLISRKIYDSKLAPVLTVPV